MFDTCVCVDIDDGSGPEEWSFKQTNPVARKEYRCCECKELIKPGQRYRREHGFWEGGWTTYMTCAPCAAIRDDLFHCGYRYGEMWSDIAESYRYAGDGKCTSLAWMHTMFADDIYDCACDECAAECARLDAEVGDGK